MNQRVERRNELLDAAERLFWSYGLQKTTVADIAREAGVSVGSVYLDFSSKNEIIEALSERHHMQVLAQMREAAQMEGLSYAQRLRDVLQARVNSFLALAKPGRHAADLFHSTCKAVKQARQRFCAEETALLAQLLLQGQEAGEFVVLEPAPTACVLLQALTSFSPPWLFQHSHDELCERLELLNRLLLEGLQARSCDARG